MIFRICLITLIHLLGFSCWAQIPNSSFESWNYDSGYLTPDGWDNLNKMAKSSDDYTCVPSGPGYPGNYYLYLITKNIPGKGIIPGLAVTGIIDTITFKPVSGIPFKGRPSELTYDVQFMPYDPSDASYISLSLTKWNYNSNKRDTIGYGIEFFIGMAHTWLESSLIINYMNEETPDSICIMISSSSSNPSAYSYLYIDNLQFLDMDSLDNNNVNTNSNNILLFPNPASNSITIQNLKGMENVYVSLYDIHHQLADQFFIENFNNETIPLKMHINNGVYLLSIDNETFHEIFKVIVLR